MLASSRLVCTSPRLRRGLTLVEMLIAIALTLVLMGTVASIFASVSGSVQKRRSAIEMSNQLRHVRSVLQSDLRGATCTTLPWQRPESSQGYFEIVEGLYCDFYPSQYTDGDASDLDGDGEPDELDPETSTVPQGINGLYFRPADNSTAPPTPAAASSGLGDWDDILAFTSRNESEPFVGRVPSNFYVLPNTNNANVPAEFARWGGTTLTSPLAEVVWFAVENPKYDTGGLLGEAGFRTIYRRALIVAPWLDYAFDGVSRPGVLRILGGENDPNDFEQPLAALVAFQERYDISVHIEFDATIRATASDPGTWVIKANTLADLTKREHRYEHHGFIVQGSNEGRRFPFNMMSAGRNAMADDTHFVADQALSNADESGWQTRPDPQATSAVQTFVSPLTKVTGFFTGRPFGHTEFDATARAMVDEEGNIQHVTTGLVPLGTIRNRATDRATRRGEDLMLSQGLAFDVQVFDPEAPVLLEPATQTALTPADSGWYRPASLQRPTLVSTGAYVDLGYAALHNVVRARLLSAPYSPTGALPILAGLPATKSQLGDARLTRVYDTWSMHYENNGLNEDGDATSRVETPVGSGIFVASATTPYIAVHNPSNANEQPLVDEGTDGFDGWGEYEVPAAIRLGVDDRSEFETAPPYNTPLRAVQVRLRVYEPDSRQIREVTVRQSFVPE